MIGPHFEKNSPRSEVVVYEIAEYYCPESEKGNCKITVRSGQNIEIVYDQGSTESKKAQALRQEQTRKEALYCPDHHLRLLPRLEEMPKLEKSKL
jgi:hypothetical protein